MCGVGKGHTQCRFSVLCVSSGITMVTHPLFRVRSLAPSLCLFIYLLAFFCIMLKADPKPTV